MKITHFKIVLFAIFASFSVNAQQAPKKTFTEKLDGIKTSGKELTKSASTDNSSIGQSGVMGTSVPLVTISSRTMTFPLSLNYSSGIKTEQQSGPVGLGWAMPIGSIIRDYGAFEPDYSSTLYEGDMKSTAVGGVDGWLNPTGSLIHPYDHNQALGYNAVEVEGERIDKPLSDFYHINVVGLPSNSFWNNGSVGGSHFWALTEKENWKIEHNVKTFEIEQEYSRINDMLINNPNASKTGSFEFNDILTSAIGVYPYVINGYADKASSNSPVGEEAKVKYEDFESFIITDDKGIQYVFGRPLRGQKFVFSDDPYWSSNACSDQNGLKGDAANGDFWKIDYIAEWLLTEIRSADYVDLNGNGIADDADAGDWIRFEYTKPTTLKETAPYGSGYFFKKAEVPTHREWNSFSQTDEPSSLMRERAYLQKIITPLQKLDLRISERFDVDHDYYSKPANQVATQNFYYEDRYHGSTGGGNATAFDVKYPVETMKYDSLLLYSRLIDNNLYKNENVLANAVVLNYAEKGSSQELAVSEYLIRNNQNVQQTGTHKPSSGGTFDIDAYKTGVKRGKTTLIGVELFDGELDDLTKTSYQFEYAYNPSYNEIHKREIIRKYSKPSIRTSYGNIPYPKSTSKINYKEEIIGTNGLLYNTVNHTNVHPDDFLIDFPYQEVYYKTVLSGQNLNDYISNGGTAIEPQNMTPVPLVQILKPVQDVYGYFYAEDCIECPKAWSLTKIIYPTGGEVSFEYERGEFQKSVDEPNWNIKENTIPLIKDYNEFAKARTYVQDSRNKYDYALNGLSIPGGPGLGLKTLSATFEVELPEYYGIRLKTKHISDKLNTPVEINYEYGDGHFTAAPAEYVQSCTAGFNQFTMRERNRHWWETDECYLGQFGAYINWTDFEDRMRSTTVTGIALDEYHATHFYESVDEILADGAFTRSHYGPLEDNTTIDYDHYNLFCIRHPGTTYEGRFVLAKNELSLSPIVMYKSELFENNALVPYKTVTNIYERVKIQSVDFEFDYTVNGTNPSNTISMWGLINDYSVYSVITHGTSGLVGMVAIGGTLSASLTLPYTPNAYSYERWGTFKTTLKETETDYKGMVSSTNYFYYPHFLLEREETEAVLTNDKYITKYEYAHQTYDQISNVFEDKNIYAAPTKTTTYLNTVAVANALSAQMITYDLTSYAVPRALDQYQYETDVDDASGTFTLVEFDVTSGTNPNWRIAENDVLEYNRFGQPIATRTNRLFNKAVYGFHNATPKATFSYIKNEFDATYSGFEDFHGRHKTSDWNNQAYKDETWFTEELDESVEPAVSVTAMNNPCNKNIPPISLPVGPYSYDSRFRNEVTIDNLSGLEIGDVVEIELVGSSYAVPNSYQSTQLTTISDIQVTDYQYIYSYGASNYKQYLLCFTTPIEFPESSYQTLPGEYNERAVITISNTTVTKKNPKYNLSSTYSRTGKYSYKLTTLRDVNNSFAKTPVRPVKIVSTPADPRCFTIPPTNQSSEQCKWTYQASAWLKYASDLGETEGGIVTFISLDEDADAIYRRGTTSQTQGTSNVKIICDIWNQTHTQLIEQKVYYAQNIDNGWKQYTVDVEIARGQEVFLDVYIQNEISQVGVHPLFRKSVFVDDICVYPKEAKYEYTTLDKFGNTTFSTNNNDVFVQNIFDEKSRLLKQQNVYGSTVSELEYFENPNWSNQNNHVTQRNWVDNGKYNETRHYIDGFGETNQVITTDISRNLRIVNDAKEYNERGMVLGVFKPYILYGSTFGDQKDGDAFQKALDTYGTPQAITLVNYEETPEAKVKEMHAPKMYAETDIISSQTEFLSVNAITHPYLTAPNNVFAIGSLLVNELVDEEGDKVRTYIDNLGRVVMEEHEIGDNHIQNTNGSLTMIANSSTLSRTWFTYDGASRIVKVHDPNGKMSQYFYNSLGLVVKSTTADKGTSEMRYDKYGQVRFVRNQKDIDAVANSVWGTDQFKYNKYDEWGRVIESGMIMAAPNSAPSVAFPTQIYFDDYSFINNQEFPASNLKLTQLHQRMVYDEVRNQFNSNALRETRIYSKHNLQTNYTYTTSTLDRTYYGYMADGQIAKTEYQYTGLTGKHTFEPVYNGMRQAVGKKYTHPSNNLYNFEWMTELDNFGRVKTTSSKHNSVTTENSTYYYDVFGNLLMKGLGNTGNPSDLHIDYFVYKNNIRDQLVNLTSKNFRFGLQYNKKGLITDQYWSTEHFDPTTGATTNINHYDYYFDKMDRLIGADYKQGTINSTSFDYFDEISTELPSDFNCTFIGGAFPSVLDPVLGALQIESTTLPSKGGRAIAVKSINALNTLLATYNQVGVPYQNMSENQENTFLEAYIEDATVVSGQNPMYYELHEANIYNDTLHIQRINLIVSGTEQALPEDLKYTKTLLSTIPFYPLLNCTPNLERSVYYYLPEFPFPTTETNANKYDAAYWYAANGNTTTLSRKANGSIKTIQTYTYASGASNRLTSVNFSMSPLPSNTQNYNYDATGNLTQEVNGSTTQTDIGYISYNDMPQSITKSSGTSYYRYDASNMRTVKEISSTDKEYYFEGVVVDQTGAVKSYQTSEGYATPDGTTVDYFYYVKDWQGTNRSVIDATGTPVNAYDHYPYGLRMPGRHFVTDGEGNRYQFTGHQYDEETTFEYHGARYYNRLLGRYMSVDPLASQFFNWSTYNYTMDNPINLVDPTGMGPEDWVNGASTGGKWEWDSEVDSEEKARKKYGDDVEYAKPGHIYDGAYLDGSDKVKLLDNGNWKWGSAHLDETVSNLSDIQKRDNDNMEYFLGSPPPQETKYLYDKGAMACHSPAGSYHETMVRSGWFLFGDMTMMLGFEVASAGVATPVIDGLLALRVAKTSTQGGLNLFKWGAPQTTKATGWKAGDYMLHLPNKGTPALNWKANYGALRSEMGLGKPIFDSYRLPNGNLIPTGGFLNAERSILQGRGWIYNSGSGAWMPPGF